MTTLVVVGQGYVGLPLAEAASSRGIAVYGLDLNESTVQQLNGGYSHIDDLANDDVSRMLTQGYKATSDYSVVREADFVTICVPTPLGSDGGPDLGPVISSAKSIAEHLQSGTTVILESTTYPGTTEEVLVPLLEESGLIHGLDFHVAFSPERVNPGFPEYGIRNTPKLVGGVTSEGTQSAVRFYSEFVETVVPLKGAKEAEMAKLLENTYRHVNIALVNEMARFSHEMDIDIWEVIRGAATKPFGFQKFSPGPGVGGHCIPIDPNYLSHHVKKTLGYPFRFVELAQEINNNMPAYVVQRTVELLNGKRKSLNGSSVLLLGVTYKPNIADQRESPAVPVAEQLVKAGADVCFYDPYVETWNIPSGPLMRVSSLRSAVKSADLVLLLQAHEDFDFDGLLEDSKLFFDTRGVAGVRAATL
ncbi:nucleotide sugar dehydrogenase [Kocuria nitroreducens]|uniref:nucleotide sugar dehydrogenase n=1 Tax=Kocuria nitroreducens TaxID=3058914 RepID=UPI0036DE0E24